MRATDDARDDGRSIDDEREVPLEDVTELPVPPTIDPEERIEVADDDDRARP